MKINNQIKILNLLNKLEKESSKDYLTGLYNRKSFRKYFTRKTKNKTNNFYCLCIADIDHFKNINDKYDHLVGDDVLKTISSKIDEDLKKYNTRLYRWEGEEFVFLLTSDTSNNFNSIIEKIRYNIYKLSINTRFENNINITMSFGGYIFND